MTPVYKLSANSVKNGRTVYGSMLAGNTAYQIPGDFESIATVTVGSGGASSVSFTSIPSTYTHLQIRGNLRADGNTDFMQFNGDTGANYMRHYVYGAGTSRTSGGEANAVSCYAGISATVANTFAPLTIDIYDYANTNKYKTTRSFSGFDQNTSWWVAMYSSCWRNTNAITSITLFAQTSNWSQYTTFALYGVK